MYSCGPPHMDVQKQDDQHELTYSNYVRTQDVTLKTCRRRWMIGRSGERGSGISVLAARHDDDDYYYSTYIHIYLKRFWIWGLIHLQPDHTATLNFCPKHRDHPHLLDMLSPQTNWQLGLRLSSTQTLNMKQKQHHRDTTTISTSIHILYKIRSIKPEFKHIHLPPSFVQSSVNQAHQTQLPTCSRDPCCSVYTQDIVRKTWLKAMDESVAERINFQLLVKPP